MAWMYLRCSWLPTTFGAMGLVLFACGQETQNGPGTSGASTSTAVTSPPLSVGSHASETSVAGAAASSQDLLPVTSGSTSLGAEGASVLTAGVSETNGPPSTDGETGASVSVVSSPGESSGAAPSEPDVADLAAMFDAYWDFETPGDTVVDVVGKREMALTGVQVETGPTGQSVVVSGEGSSGQSADSPVDTSKDFSISVWVKLDQLDGFDTFVGIDGEQVSSVFLQKRSDERLSLTTMPTDSTSASSCVATAEIQPRPGEWYHVVGTRSAATREQRVYVDGVLSGETRCPDGVFSANGGVTVGRGLYGGEHADWMNGTLDELGLASRVLEPAEIFDLYRAGRPEANNYLFAYFVEVQQGRGDGLRLAQSHDGLQWGAIGGGKVFMPPSVGGGSFRDPHVMRDPKGLYHLVWTTSCVPWAESNCQQDRGFGHASSPDLVQWSAADYVTIALDVEHVWAPETFYDEASEQFMVFWSSPLDNSPSASDPHSIYYLLTKDFKAFTEPQILYSKAGRNFIDATIRNMGSSLLMLIKDEADGQKNLRALSSPVAFGPQAWTADPSAPITGNYAAEGPSLLERGGELYIYFDKYGEGKYGALQASSSASLDTPSAWQDISSAVFFPGVRHGTPIEVPWDVYRAVALEAGE